MLGHKKEDGVRQAGMEKWRQVERQVDRERQVRTDRTRVRQTGKEEPRWQSYKVSKRMLMRERVIFWVCFDCLQSYRWNHKEGNERWGGGQRVTFAQQPKLKLKHNAEIVKQEPLDFTADMVPSIICGMWSMTDGGGVVESDQNKTQHVTNMTQTSKSESIITSGDASFTNMQTKVFP